MKMAELANYATDNGVATPFEYGTNPNDPNTWDWDHGYGCLCDNDWQGYDCSQRSCPTGDDVTTTGQSDEVQELWCHLITNPAPSAASPTFRLRFREAVTAPILWQASAADLEQALEALPTVGDLSIVYSNTPALDEACPSDNSENKITFVFSANNGDLPAITVEEDDGFTQGTDLRFQLETGAGAFSATYEAREVVKGTTEDVECSGRGICDHSSGVCKCFPGFGDSDGSGGKGGRGDCGFREPFPFGKPGWQQ
jgi:hypothetical protein